MAHRGSWQSHGHGAAQPDVDLHPEGDVLRSAESDITCLLYDTTTQDMLYIGRWRQLPPAIDAIGVIAEGKVGEWCYAYTHQTLFDQAYPSGEVALLAGVPPERIFRNTYPGDTVDSRLQLAAEPQHPEYWKLEALVHHAVGEVQEQLRTPSP